LTFVFSLRLVVNKVLFSVCFCFVWSVKTFCLYSVFWLVKFTYSSKKKKIHVLFSFILFIVLEVMFFFAFFFKLLHILLWHLR
jgi:hypothetical protein